MCGDNPGRVLEEPHPSYEQFAQQLSEKNGTPIPKTLSEEIEYLLNLNQSIRDTADAPEQIENFERIAQKKTKS